jgi:8-oxo-dGTP pyrophosphatase MutT (NUDIX family)
MSGNYDISNNDLTNKQRIEEHVSAGGVVYRVVDGDIQTVLCGRNSPIRWSLAKGTPDDGETLEQTAIREVREETGLDVEIIQPIKQIDYWFSDKHSHVKYHKTVHFYLMSLIGGSTDRHDVEFDVVEWFTLADALTNLNYQNEVRVLELAVGLISSRIRDGK